MDEARDEKAKAVKDFAAQMKVPNVPFGLAAGRAEAAGEYGIKDDHDLSVILYTRAKVAKRWAFTADKQPTDADVDAIIEAAKALLK